ncbi:MULTISPECIES: pentapeptide repeat-containing protein [unclassified Nodularia (in: cyanobacteria)]|uniref:pentapeptide repeat-containing protein n=1 Tax=unclassified Nodularia (in: cyanobacteria) TaxID=2656917 RepID=UPI00187FB980|nr:MULTISPECIES: pentapeptide repeat-containing protein [unclassified Nodularia (in: cyanobacteria)]MBE9199161.1 pentapeptide repeat-containing protein [Nodularia sp. LEGE 06071]MCC2694101.1 pentapeptide repeat-containing protein [Nodularia sp. LEGE 04288]
MHQDYSGKNLRGRSFKGQKLEGADFSYADIRGANFTGANLKNANFSHAQCGLQKRWAIFLVAVSWLLSAISGFFSAFTGYLISLIFDSSDIENQIGGWTALIVVIIVFIVILVQGLNSAIAIAIAFAFAFAGAIIAAAAAAAIVGAFAEAAAGVIAGVGAIAIAAAIAAAIVGAAAIAIVGAFAGAIAAAFAGAIAAAFAGAIAAAAAFAGAAAIAGAAAVGGTLFSAYIAWRAMKGDEKFSLIQKNAVAFAAFGGTSFRRADLTDANFTAATLKSTDFRKATLIRTCFQKTKKLNRVRPGFTYLDNAQLQQLLFTGAGQEMNFERQDLRGVNLKGFILTDANFIGANLSGANLQDADLSRAKLVQSQLDGTDFTGATLTGAYIQDWGITNNTKFDGVRCEYVYMHLPTKEKPNPLRKPDNNKEVFADGEFADFIQPIFDTLDLYHNQGVDPRAVAISFKQLAENHPEAELEIVSMEKRGQDKFLLRTKTAPTADKSELSAEYFDTYNQLKGLPEAQIKLLLAEKDNQISRLENMVMTALERPHFYSSTQIQEVSAMNNNPGGFSIGGSVGGNVNNLQGDNNQAVFGDGNQVTQKNHTGADGESSLTKDDVVKLMAELETLIKGSELPADTKEEVIEDLNAAKKATDKEEPNKQRALERLTSVATTIEKTTKTVDASRQLWTTAKPIFVKLLGWLGAAGLNLLG